MAFCHCVWMLLACACSCACAAALAGSDCGEECALCLLGQQDAFSTLTCSMECDGEPDGEKLRLCWDALTQEPDRLPFDGQDADAGGGDPDSPESPPAKKYGGFMKRYGGFMARRSPSSDNPAAAAVGAEREEKVRLEILKILNTASQSGDPAEAPAAKRYGGFLRRADDEGELRGRLLEAVLDRGLRKRYGGFMRRVGRPEWLLDGGGVGKSGGVSKRAREEGPQQKRYGGFMD
ncbi:proenkephalin-A-like [Stigmatopora nigra]